MIASRLAERPTARARLLPVRNGVLRQPRFGVVLSEQLGVRLNAPGKPNLQYLGNVLMVPLAGAPQHGLIGRVLDEGMLEAVRRLRRQPLLVQELRRH